MRASNLQSVNLTDKQFNRVMNYHFASSAAIIAPFPGGFYVAYSVRTTLQLEIREFTNSLSQVRILPLNAAGTVLGFTHTVNKGFAILVRDSADTNRAYLWVLNSDGTTKWSRNIMNNGANPTVAVDQITFNDSAGAPLFGMKAMFRPDNGRIAFGNNWIGVAIGHYNFFGFRTDGSRDDHTGDTYYSFDFNNAMNVKLGWGWGTSHSLLSRVIYNGVNFSFAALGDAYPQQIRFSTVATGAGVVSGTLPSQISSAVVSGSIPGDGGGRACGRLGDINVISTSPLTLGASYVRWQCSTTSTFLDPFTNNVNEVAWLVYTPGLVSPYSFI